MFENYFGGDILKIEAITRALIHLMMIVPAYLEPKEDIFLFCAQL